MSQWPTFHVTEFQQKRNGESTDQDDKRKQQSAVSWQNWASETTDAHCNNFQKELHTTVHDEITCIFEKEGNSSLEEDRENHYFRKVFYYKKQIENPVLSRNKWKFGHLHKTQYKDYNGTKNTLCHNHPLEEKCCPRHLNYKPQKFNPKIQVQNAWQNSFEKNTTCRTNLHSIKLHPVQKIVTFTQRQNNENKSETKN